MYMTHIDFPGLRNDAGDSLLEGYSVLCPLRGVVFFQGDIQRIGCLLTRIPPTSARHTRHSSGRLHRGGTSFQVGISQRRIQALPLQPEDLQRYSDRRRHFPGREVPLRFDITATCEIAVQTSGQKHIPVSRPHLLPVQVLLLRFRPAHPVHLQSIYPQSYSKLLG